MFFLPRLNWTTEYDTQTQYKWRNTSNWTLAIFQRVYYELYVARVLHL